MKQTVLATAAAIALGATLTHNAVAAQPPVPYSIIQLTGPDATYEETDGSKINSAGSVVGYAYQNTFGQAMRWDPVAGSSSTMTATPYGHLGVRPGINVPTSFANSLNNFGSAVGWSTKVEGGVEKGSRAVKWAAGSTDPIELPALSLSDTGHSVNGAYDVNDAGVVAGYARKHLDDGFSVPFRPVRWDANTNAITELQMPATIDPTLSGLARSINSAGVVVGDTGGRAVRWAAGSTTPVMLMPPVLPANGHGSQAWAINDAGTAVGNYSNYDLNGLNFALRWAPGATTGTLLPGTADGGAYFASAYDITNSGVIAGSGWRGNVSVALVWDPTQTFAVDLNTLLPADSGWNLIAANSINENGWISGYGTYDPDGGGGVPSVDGGFPCALPRCPSRPPRSPCSASSPR